MGRFDEPKMDDLKRLLRRLDGLDGKGPNKPAQESETTQRGYVGALRGTPMVDDGELAIEIAVPAAAKSSGAAIFFAAVAAAVFSTVTVYFLLSRPPVDREAGPVPSSSQGAVPSRLELKSPPPATGSGRQSADTDETLIRRAELLLQAGEVGAARTILQQAAEQGSGAAALKLGRSYDPGQSGGVRYADSRTNPALAQAWYERALALGVREAASYIADKGPQ